jgi:hypothetical protein
MHCATRNRKARIMRVALNPPARSARRLLHPCEPPREGAA